MKKRIKKRNVSLYKREFLGIDKSCDKKTNIEEDDYKKLRKNQNMEFTLLLVQLIIIFSFSFALVSDLCISCCCNKRTIFNIRHFVLFHNYFFNYEYNLYYLSSCFLRKNH